MAIAPAPDVTRARDGLSPGRARSLFKPLVVGVLSLVATGAGPAAAIVQRREVPPLAVSGITRASASSSHNSMLAELRRSKPRRSLASTPATLLPILPPSSRHPLVLLKIGDSLGEELGFGLRDVLANVPHVTVLQEAIGDSGLARPDFYNWPVHLRAELSQYRPSTVVVMLGGDDGQGFVDQGRTVVFGTALWNSVYSQRVAALMAVATSAGVRVMWVGLPIMGSPYFSAEMAKMNGIYASEAAHHLGVTFVSTWSLFANASGAYSAYLAGPSGQLELMRNPDGVHFSGAGEDRLATLVVTKMNTAWKTHV